MNYKTIRIIIGVICSSFAGQFSYAQDTINKTLTLEQCIQIALENNMEAVRSGLSVKRQHADLKQSRYNLLPQLAASASHEWSQGRYIDPTTNLFVTEQLTSGYQSVNASVVLFDGLASFNRIRQQAYALRAAEMEELDTKNQLVVNVAVAYIRAITSKDMIEQTKDQLSVTVERVRRNEVMNEKGAMLPGDYYDFQGEYNADMNRLIDAENSYNEALTELLRLLNRPFDKNLQLAPLGDAPPVAMRTDDPDGLYERAAAHLGVIRAADMRKRQADYEVKVFRSIFLPRLGLNGGFNSRYSGNSEDAYYTQMQDNLGRYAGLSLQIPIFGRMENRTNISKAKLNLKEASYQAETRRNELQQDVQRALFDLDASKERYENLVKQVENYAESFRVAQLRFDTGAINSVDYLVAKNKMDNANANLIIARYQWHLRQFIIDFYNGEKNYLMAE